jgi:L-lactate dehydrogenase (cytochrome)
MYLRACWRPPGGTFTRRGLGLAPAIGANEVGAAAGGSVKWRAAPVGSGELAGQRHLGEWCALAVDAGLAEDGSGRSPARVAVGFAREVDGMKPREIRELVRWRGFEPDPARRVLGRCHDIGDLRRAAQRRLPRPVFGYADGAADEELTLRANHAALRRWRFRPWVLRDVAQPDLRMSVLGSDLPMPIGLAPTGFTRVFHPAGELAVARAAASRGVPYGLSTCGTFTIEQVAETGHPNLWFQLYVLRDRKLTAELVDRAAAAGYGVLEVTVDTPVGGRRTRDLRTGFTAPPMLTTRALVDIAVRPGYWMSMLTAPALRYASFTAPGTGVNTIADITAMFDPSLSWDDLADLRARWPGKLLLKGPLGPEDAVRAASAGVDGIHLSNHGGRQLDRCVPTIDLVRPVREAVGEQVAIVVDSGIRHGADVAVALARGADMCMIGRGYLYGLAAAGQPGVEHTIDLLAGQLRRTMQLLGVTTVDELRKHGDDLVVPAGGPG